MYVKIAFNFILIVSVLMLDVVSYLKRVEGKH